MLTLVLAVQKPPHRGRIRRLIMAVFGYIPEDQEHLCQLAGCQVVVAPFEGVRPAGSVFCCAEHADDHTDELAW